jgi:hypothetical protein
MATTFAWYKPHTRGVSVLTFKQMVPGGDGQTVLEDE